MAQDTSQQPINIHALRWDGEHSDESLNRVAAYAVVYARDCQAWYQKSSRPKKRAAQWIRGIVVISTASGGILPVIAGLETFKWLNPVLASIVLAFGATALAFDRYYGFSSAWMRYIITELKLKGMIEVFELEWLQEKAIWQMKDKPEAVRLDYTRQMLGRCARFTTDVSKLVEDETLNWVDEFKQNITNLDSELKAQSDEMRKAYTEKMAQAKRGGIHITLTNEQPLKNWELFLDSEPIRLCHGKTAGITNIAPGMHTVAAKMVAGEQTLSAEATVKISPETIEKVELELS